MIVYKFGARPAGADVREQMRLADVYYNQLVEAENARRRAGWGAEEAPAPPDHECPKKDCELCHAHWTAVRARVKEQPPVDARALRTARPAGLYWGSYLIAEESFSMARRTTDTIYPISFRRWEKGGQMGVQIQGGDLGTQWQIERTDTRTGRRARGGLGRHVLRLRIGTAPGGRAPIWSEPIRFEMHRAVLGRIRWVKVTMRHVADREVWHVHFVASDEPARTDNAVDGVVAIDISWRRIGDDLRLAYASDGSELRLGPTWIECGARADRIRSHRADLANELIASDGRLAQIRSPRGVARRLRQLERDGEDIGDAARAWRARDLHLWRYEDGCRRRVAAVRRDAMRKWIRELARKHRHAVVKDSSHKQIKELHDLPRPAARNGHIAAPGEIVEWVRRVWGDDNMAIVPAMDTTDQCIRCGEVNDHGAELLVTCERCGDTIDRDVASTQNMLRRWAAGDCAKPTARKRTARFAKRHVKKEELTECQPDGA